MTVWLQVRSRSQTVHSMASTKRDDVMSWLRDAHAMEAAHVDNLDRLIRLSDEYPQLKMQLQKHLAMSSKQRVEIEQV